MGKALGLLPSWYWPEGVQRYLAAPRVAIYELAVARWAKRYGGDPALVTNGETQTFRQLDAACARVAGALLARFEGEPPRVALAVDDGAAFAPLFLGALRVNAAVLLLTSPDPSPLREFGAGIVISSIPGVEGEPPAAFLAADPPSSPPRPAMIDATKPAIALPSGEGLAWHSHASLMSAAMAFAAFVSLETKDRLLVATAPGSWEGLIGLLAPLQAGGAALATSPGDPESVARATTATAPRVAWIGESAAAGLAGGNASPVADALREVRPVVYVSTSGQLDKPLRRSLRHRLRSHVLGVYGYPECGPIAADHVTWYLEASAGISMVGVDILALDPATGQPSDLPWSVLSYGGIGAKTQAVAPNRRTAPTAEGAAPDATWFVTGDQGVLDSNGMLFLRR